MRNLSFCCIKSADISKIIISFMISYHFMVCWVLIVDYIMCSIFLWLQNVKDAWSYKLRERTQNMLSFNKISIRLLVSVIKGLCTIACISVGGIHSLRELRCLGKMRLKFVNSTVKFHRERNKILKKFCVNWSKSTCKITGYI